MIKCHESRGCFVLYRNDPEQEATEYYTAYNRVRKVTAAVLRKYVEYVRK